MWDLPGSGIKPASAALAGGFFTAEPPGKCPKVSLFQIALAESFGFPEYAVMSYEYKVDMYQNWTH